MLELAQTTVAFFTTKSGSILASLIVAAVLIGGAYYFSGGSVAQVSAATTNDILKAFATKDTDGDGLPDWEEALYGTDPNNPDTFNLGMTDGEAVAKGLIKLKIGTNAPAAATSTASLASDIPGPEAASSSMTAQFAQAFISNYLSTRGSQPPTADEETQFVQGAVANLVQTQVRPDAYSESDITVSGSGAAALTAYAAAAQAAFAAHSVHTQYDELTYFQDAVQKDDPASITALKQISQEYIGAAAALAAVPVPQEAAVADLAVVNAMARVGATIGDFAVIDSDPIRSLVALGDYEQDAANLGTTLARLHAVFATEGITIAPTDPGGEFYGLTEDMASVAASSTQAQAQAQSSPQ